MFSSKLLNGFLADTGRKNSYQDMLRALNSGQSLSSLHLSRVNRSDFRTPLANVWKVDCLQLRPK